MRDPLPENIDGRKEYRHAFEHHIDWGQVILGAGVIAAAYVAYRVFVEDGSAGEQDDDLPTVELEEGHPQFEDSSLWSGMREEQTHG